MYDLNNLKISNKFRTLIKPNSNKNKSEEFETKTLEAMINLQLELEIWNFLSGIDSSLISLD